MIEKIKDSLVSEFDGYPMIIMLGVIKCVIGASILAIAIAVLQI